MEESNFIAVVNNQITTSTDSTEDKRECVNAVRNDELQIQDFDNVNFEHTTHVHTAKTADFVENEFVFDPDGTHSQVVKEGFVFYSSEYDNVETNIVHPGMVRDVEKESDESNFNTVEAATSSAVEDMEVEEQKKEKFDVEKLGYELQVGYKILINLMGAGNRFVNKLFLYPVDASFPETEKYYKKIKEPMWMNKMKEKFENLEYDNLAEFMADFKLMIENCYRFNGPDNFVSKKAQKLEMMMKQKIALLSKDLRAKLLGSVNTEDDILASAGIRRRVRNPNLAAEDESQALLTQLRRDKAAQEREDRRQRSDDRKALEAARIHEIQSWEDELVGEKNKQNLRTMWELPQIGLFVYLCMECLGLEEEVTQYQLERGLVAPRECSDFRRLMTCLLSTQHQRKSVKTFMPYNVWNKKLSQKLDNFYKVLSDCGNNHQQACYKLGFDNRAFLVMGKSNPLLKKQFHQLSFLKRVWILKNYCDFCVESQNYLQKTIEEAEAERPMDVREVLLGSDGRGYRYINFPMFTGKDIRIYRHPKLQEPSLSSLGMENWSMVEEKPSASSSRCSTPVNQKLGRYSEPQSSSLRARAILQAAESCDPSPVRASPDLHDENSNSNQGPSSVSSETNDPVKNNKSGSSGSFKKRKRGVYSGKRKRLKASSRKELLMDELTDSPGTEKDEDGSVKEDDQEDSQGFSVPKFVKVNGEGSSSSAICDKACDKACDNSIDGDKNSSSEVVSASSSSESLSSSSATSGAKDSVTVRTATMAQNIDSSVAVVENGSDRKENGNVSDKTEADLSGENDQDSQEMNKSCNENDKVENKICESDNVEMKETVAEDGNGGVDNGKKDNIIKNNNDSVGGGKANESKAITESSNSEFDSVNTGNNQDSAYLSCDSEKSVHTKELEREKNSSEEEDSIKKENFTQLSQGDDNGSRSNLKTETGIDVKMELETANSLNMDSKVKLECDGEERSKFGEDVKLEKTSGVKKEGTGDADALVNSKSEQPEVKTENDVKEEPEGEEESDEEELPDLGRIELVAESMEEIRTLMNKLSNPDPIKRGKRVYPGVIKPCEEELLGNLTRFHDELVKYEKSLFNARVHAQIKLRKEMDSYSEPKPEESKGWESETSQSSKESSDDEDGAGDSNKKEKLQKVSSTSSSSKKSKSSKSMTDFLSSAASKLASINSDANNEDSNDGYELDISSRGRLRKRRVIPNNTEDTLLKKRKNLSQELLSTASTTITTPTTLSSTSSSSSLSSTIATASSTNIHSLSQSQILSMLSSGSTPQPRIPTSMPCQIVRFISPSGDATSYKTVRLISGTGGKPNMVLSSPEKFAGNIQFVSNSGIVTIPRSKFLATSTQSSHPVIQNLLKSQGKGVASQVILQKNLMSSSTTSTASKQQHQQQFQVGEQRLLSKILSSNTGVSTHGMKTPNIPTSVSAITSPSKQGFVETATSSTTAVVVTQVSNSFMSQGGKQVLDLGSLSVTQIQQLVKNQAIQINTGAGNSTTLLLTTGLQQLSAASKGGVGVGTAAALPTACTTVASAGGVRLGGTHQIKMPVQNIAVGSNPTLLTKNLSGHHMTVVPRNNNNINSSQQALPVIRTIINRPAMNTVRTTTSSIIGSNIVPNVINLNSQQQQQQRQATGLFTIVSGSGTALKQIPTAQGIGMSSATASPVVSQNIPIVCSTIQVNNQQQAANALSHQGLFTVVSGGTALKQIPAPRIISSFNQNMLISSQGPNTSANITNASNKENPHSTVNNVVIANSHTNSKLSTTIASEVQKPNWVTIPMSGKRYAGNVTVKALLENRNATKKCDNDVSSSNGSVEVGSESFISKNEKQETDSIGAAEVPKPEGLNANTQQQPALSSSESSSAALDNEENKKELVTSTLLSSSIPVTQALSVDAAIQPLLVSSLQVSLPTVNIKVPSPNTLPSMTHNKHSTTIVQSTKVPIPVASTVDSNHSPITQFSCTTTNMGLPSGQNQNNTTATVVTPSSATILIPPKPPTQTQTGVNVNNINNPTSATTDLKNVMLKVTPPKGGTGQFVQGYMTSQGKLVIPQAALFPQQQQQVIQAGPNRVILANNNASSQPAQLHTKLPAALLNGSSQVRLAQPNSNNNNNNNSNTVTVNKTPEVHIVGQQNNQLVIANTAQQQPSNSVSNNNLSARAIPVQSGNPGIKLMLINPSAVPGLQNVQQSMNMNRSIAGGTSIVNVIASSSSQQQPQAIQTSTPASELVKQIANSTQLQAAAAAQQLQQNSSSNPVGKSVQVVQPPNANPTVTSQGQVNPGASPLAAHILTLPLQQQGGNKINLQQQTGGQPQQIQQGGQIVLGKPQQPTPSSQPGAAISLQLQQLNQILTPNVNIRGLTPLNPQLQQQGTQGLLTSVPKSIQQAQVVQLAINAAQNQNTPRAAAVVPPSARVVQVPGQLSPQIQLPNQNPLQAITPPVVPQQVGLIIQQQPSAVLQPTQQLVGPPVSNVVQLQQNNGSTIIQQQQQPPPQPKPVQEQASSSLSSSSSSSLSTSTIQQQQQKHPQVLTNSQIVRQQPLLNLSALSANQNQNQAQIQFVINQSASSANLARFAKPVIHPVIRAVAPSTPSSSSLSSLLSSTSPSIPPNNTTNTSVFLNKSASSSEQIPTQISRQTPQQVVLSQNLPASSNQFIISPIKLGTPQNPQTRLVNPVKLISPVQTIIQSTGSTLTDQRTNQLVIQNTSQLHNVIQTNKFLPHASTQSPRPTHTTVSNGNSLVDNNINNVLKAGNVLLNQPEATNNTNTGLVKQVIVSAASLPSLQQQHVSNIPQVSSKPNSFVYRVDEKQITVGNICSIPPTVHQGCVVSGSSTNPNQLSTNVHLQNLVATAPPVPPGIVTAAHPQHPESVVLSVNGSDGSKNGFGVNMQPEQNGNNFRSVKNPSSQVLISNSNGNAQSSRLGMESAFGTVQHSNGLDSGKISDNSAVVSSPSKYLGVRRNTFGGSQDKMATVTQRQRSVDESGNLASSVMSEESDEKEAALNLLTLANQPL